jgi:general secretion pathway protein L
MAVFRDGIPLFFRAITNEPAATVRESLAALELTEGIKVERLYVFGGLSQEQLQRSPEGVAITRLPIDRMASAFGGDSAMATNFAGAFALALARDDRQLVNFRHGDLAFQSARDPQRRQLTIAASLVIILFLLLLTDSLVRYRQVYRDASSVDGGIKSIYGQIFPGRKGSRDEVGEVRAEIRRLGGVAPTTRVLATLRTIAQAKGAEVTTLYEVTVEKGEVRIKGEGVSSEGVNAFRRRLEPSFASVELVESESRGALVNFVIRCRMREGG